MASALVTMPFAKIAPRVASFGSGKMHPAERLHGIATPGLTIPRHGRQACGHVGLSLGVNFTGCQYRLRRCGRPDLDISRRGIEDKILFLRLTASHSFNLYSCK